jgi:TMEM175 potassium channel family protein
MSSTRLEAFSDAVIAILITIMVLQLSVPNGSGFGDLRPLLPVVLTYALSFVYLAIYWNNHHHLLYVTQHVTGGVLWANMHLLFWLSLVPFVTSWMGENHFAATPAALYGVVLLLAAMAYYVLVRVIIAGHEKNSALAAAVGRDVKGKISVGLYAVAIPSAFALVWVAYGLYVTVALIWLVPDRRIERALAAGRNAASGEDRVSEPAGPPAGLE